MRYGALSRKNGRCSSTNPLRAPADTRFVPPVLLRLPHRLRRIAAIAAFGGALGVAVPTSSGCVRPALPCADASDCGGATCIEGLCAQSSADDRDDRWGLDLIGTGVDERGAVLPPEETGIASFAFARRLIVEGRRVSGDEPLLGFPLLVQLSLPDLRSEANGGGVRRAGGEDIAFFDADGELLSFEIEAWDAANGALTAWVHIPTLSPTAGAELWLAWGRDLPVWGDTPAVWDGSYRGVWHMGDAPSGGLIHDATSTGSDGLPEHLTDDDLQDAMVGQGVGFARRDAAIDIVLEGEEPWAGETTVEAWARIDSSSTGIQSVFRTDDDDVMLWVGDDGSFGPSALFIVDGHMAICVLSPLIEGALGGDVDGWHHYAGVLATGTLGGTEASVVRLYIDGVLCDAISALGIPEVSPVARLGNGGLDVTHLDGVVDELRVARVALSEGWLRTTVENVLDPTSFVLVAESESAP